MAPGQELAPIPQAPSKQKSLELLFDYTKFHIGVYLTLTGSYLTAATAKFAGARILNVKPWLAWPAIFAFMIAGLAGGIIASSITQTTAGDSREFLDEAIGPWNWKRLRLRARAWTYLEHTAFWVGLLCAVISFSGGESGV